MGQFKSRVSTGPGLQKGAQLIPGTEKPTFKLSGALPVQSYLFFIISRRKKRKTNEEGNSKPK